MRGARKRYEVWLGLQFPKSPQLQRESKTKEGGGEKKEKQLNQEK